MDAALARAWLEETARVVAAERDRLTALDAAIGDADHGTNLDRGFSEVRRAMTGSSPGELLVSAGSALIRKVGGASGPLYGSAFRSLGKALDAERDVTLEAFAAAFEAAVSAVERLGRAAEGDKTMVDALRPAARALARAVRDGLEPREALDQAARAAEEGAKATIPLTARKGRASYLGERSAGHEDPGAVSAALIVRALHTVATRW
ncbi:dihydroxyacetone kinase subunit DhaL [Thermoactinospora rubra]|uniref:dihydroxyacetone kinase subunit DhaL n=1 Tax=Thermoactinospora rubra TaxID=1088767 RepID=UPI000A104679|nr:dihydroxyacetone kinase subunit DhaL [Thermoactinospora rubra]